MIHIKEMAVFKWKISPLKAMRTEVRLPATNPIQAAPPGGA
jgi:hypothetical protein